MGPDLEPITCTGSTETSLSVEPSHSVTEIWEPDIEPELTPSRSSDAKLSNPLNVVVHWSNRCTIPRSSSHFHAEFRSREDVSSRPTDLVHTSSKKSHHHDLTILLLCWCRLVIFCEIKSSQLNS